MPPAPVHAVAAAQAMPLVDASVDLTVMSPPYALDIKYIGGDISAETWPDFTVAWLADDVLARLSHRLEGV